MSGFFSRLKNELLEDQQTKELRELAARHRFDVLKELKTAARALQLLRFEPAEDDTAGGSGEGDGEATPEDGAAQVATGASSDERTFAESEEAVARLVAAIEAAVYHGLKQKGNPQSTIGGMRGAAATPGNTGTWRISAAGLWSMLEQAGNRLARTPQDDDEAHLRRMSYTH